jgi:hypothetical protein
LLAGCSHDDDKRGSWDRNHECVVENHDCSIGQTLADVSGFEAAKV